jgi:hypothetical protein
MEYSSMNLLDYQVSRNTTTITSHVRHGEHQPHTISIFPATITSLSNRHHVDDYLGIIAVLSVIII